MIPLDKNTKFQLYITHMYKSLKTCMGMKNNKVTTVVITGEVEIYDGVGVHIIEFITFYFLAFFMLGNKYSKMLLINNLTELKG